MPEVRKPPCVFPHFGIFGGTVKTLNFGPKLNLLRRAQGLTIGQLFSKTGVPEKTLERILGGQNAPSAAHLVRIVRALNIDMDAIEPEDLE